MAIISLLSGPLLGIAGTVISNWFKQKDAKINLDAKRIDYDHELALHKLNQTARSEELEGQAYLANMQMATETLTESYKHDTGYGKVPDKWVVLFRAVRPVLTIGLFFALLVILFLIDNTQYHMNGMTIQERIVTSLVTMFELSVTWWFGDRQINKATSKKE